MVLGIDVYDEEPHGCSVRLWSDTRGERILQMERTEVPGGIRYQASVELDEPELLELEELCCCCCACLACCSASS